MVIFWSHKIHLAMSERQMDFILLITQRRPLMLPFITLLLFTALASLIICSMHKSPSIQMRTAWRCWPVLVCADVHF